MKTIIDFLNNLTLKGYFLISGGLVILVLTLIVVATSGLGDDSEAIKLLQIHGFSNVTIQNKGGGAMLYGCGRDDLFWYQANAINPAGKDVSNLLVCCGAVKGCTLRSK